MRRSQVTFRIFQNITADDWHMEGVTENEFRKLSDKIVVGLVKNKQKNRDKSVVNGIYDR